MFCSQVDVKVISEGKGGMVYKDHLPVLGMMGRLDITARCCNVVMSLPYVFKIYSLQFAWVPSTH